MALSRGYITPKQTEIWDLKKRGFPEATIARRLNVTRQTVHKAVDVANARIPQALIEAARLNRMEVKSVDPSKGILTGYSREFETSAIVTFSARNGIQVWYQHEGDCKRCERLEACRETLLTEMEERNIKLDKCADLVPSKLAEHLFRRIMEE